MRERIRDYEMRIKKNEEGSKGIFDAIEGKYKNYQELCSRLNQSQAIEVIQNENGYSYTLKEPLKQILKGPEEKKVNHENISEEASFEGFVFMLGRIRSLRQTIDSGSKRIKLQHEINSQKIRALQEEKERLAKKVKENENVQKPFG